jgi:catechol 2,3-dioxygenase-like lactoylglutathione lyase family enzyme
MIGYVTLGTNQYDAAIKFYDDLLAVIGATRMYEADAFTAWSTGPKAPAISVSKPFDQQPATVGNGVMVAILVSSAAQVDEVHAKAMALGATDEGAPGPRQGGLYVGYFRDLDGNKLNAFCISDS